MDWPSQIAVRTLWGEARGEIMMGQKAVAHVFANRVKDGRWGHTLATVCLWPYQFSCWLPADPNVKHMAALDDTDPLLVAFYGYVQAALTGEHDPTNGSTHYYAISIPPPNWTVGATLEATIGNHKFYSHVK